MSLNKAMIIGRLGQDPDLRTTGNGTPVTTLSVATDRKYNGPDGQTVGETEWHRVTMFARLAEVAGEYLKKGRQVYIEGRLRTRKYTDSNGAEKYSTEIVAEQMQMLGDRGGSSGATIGSGYGSPGSITGNRATVAVIDDIDDDIPF